MLRALRELLSRGSRGGYPCASCVFFCASPQTAARAIAHELKKGFPAPFFIYESAFVDGHSFPRMTQFIRLWLCDQMCHFAGAAVALPCSIFAELPCSVLADSGCSQCAGCCGLSQCMSTRSAWPAESVPLDNDPRDCIPGRCTANPFELCFYDPSFKSGGLGCNAGGLPLCRFCGFGDTHRSSARGEGPVGPSSI